MMPTESSLPHYAERRGELLAQSFLTDLGLTYLAKVTTRNVPYDYLAAFTTPDGSAVSFGVEVKGTQRPISKTLRFEMPARAFKALAKSNLPTLILIADVKNNALFFNWANLLAASVDLQEKHGVVTIPVRRVSPETQRELLKQIIDLAHVRP